MAKWKKTIRLDDVNPRELALLAGVSGINGGQMDFMKEVDEAIIGGEAEAPDNLFYEEQKKVIRTVGNKRHKPRRINVSGRGSRRVSPQEDLCKSGDLANIFSICRIVML